MLLLAFMRRSTCSLLLVLAACRIAPLDAVGKRCSDLDPCPAPLVCAPPESSATGEVSTLPVGGTCTASACAGVPCGEGSVCIEGSCHARDCATVPCGNGQICIDGRCASTACLGESCPDAGCYGGRCYPSQCPGAACGAQQLCVNGACTDLRCDGLRCPPQHACAQGRCYPESCDGGAPCPGGLCDQGRCTDRQCLGVPCPGSTPYCVAGQCRSCAEGSVATPDGGCGALLAPGAACTTDEACTTGHCVDGACCQTAACGPCNRCGGAGQCAAAYEGLSGPGCTGGTCTAGVCARACATGGGCGTCRQCTVGADGGGLCTAAGGRCAADAGQCQAGTCVVSRAVQTDLDTWVSEVSGRSHGNGRGSRLVVGQTNWVSPVMTVGPNRSWLRFPLPPPAAGGVVSSAALQLRLKRPATGESCWSTQGSPQFFVERLTGDFTENSVADTCGTSSGSGSSSWQHDPAFDPAHRAKYIGTPTGEERIAVDVTALVASGYDAGRPALAVRLIAATGTAYDEDNTSRRIVLQSRENGDAGAPYLEVKWVVP